MILFVNNGSNHGEATTMNRNERRADVAKRALFWTLFASFPYTLGSFLILFIDESFRTLPIKEAREDIAIVFMAYLIIGVISWYIAFFIRRKYI